MSKLSRREEEELLIIFNGQLQEILEASKKNIYVGPNTNPIWILIIILVVILIISLILTFGNNSNDDDEDEDEEDERQQGPINTTKNKNNR